MIDFWKIHQKEIKTYIRRFLDESLFEYLVNIL